MKVSIDSWAWIDKADLTTTQLHALRSQLTILPRYADENGSGPILLYTETDESFGMAREYYLARRKASHAVEFLLREPERVAGYPRFVGTLREDQERAAGAILRELGSGRLGGILRAAPAFGKTVVCCAMMARLQVRTLIVLHKEFLLDQWTDRIARFLPDAEVGRIQGGVCELAGRHIVLATVQSLAQHPYGPDVYAWPDLLVADECFPGGTEVSTPRGPCRIEDLRVGDEIWSAAGLDVVGEAGSRIVPSYDLRLLRFGSGNEVVCTRDHPFLSREGWVSAGDLNEGSEVLSYAGCIDAMRGHGNPSSEADEKSLLLSYLLPELDQGDGVVENGEAFEKHVPVGALGIGVDHGVRSSEEGRLPAWLRVAGVSIPERTDLDRLGIRCHDRAGGVEVFNLRVRRHPSFVLHNSGALVHNCHRMGAATWSQVPPLFSTKWRIGASATPRRKDGADDCFLWHIGPVLYAATDQRLPVTVKRVWSKFRMLSPSFSPSRLIARALMLQLLTSSTERNVLIVDQLVRAAEAGRKILVLSERLQHLDRLDRMFRTEWRVRFGTEPPSVGYYVGGQSRQERLDAEECRLIFATTQLASEGLDIPALDTLLLATPTSDVEQIAGRIQRPHPGKKSPILIDIYDDGVPQLRQVAKGRAQTYPS